MSEQRLIDANAIVSEVEKYINPMADNYGLGFLSGISTAISCIEEAPTIEPVRGEWISVEDRLPEEKGEYLVAFHPCYWDNVMEETMVGFDTFRGKTKWAKAKYQRVTHWMPLPEPPKEDAP